MTYLSPAEKKQRRFNRLRTAGIVLVGLIIATLLDFPLLHLFYNNPAIQIGEHDWYRALRVLGFMGTWIVVGILFGLHDRSRHRGLSIFYATISAGIIAELLKMTFARERPVHEGVIQKGFYHFRGLFSGFSDAPISDSHQATPPSPSPAASPLPPSSQTPKDSSSFWQSDAPLPDCSPVPISPPMSTSAPSSAGSSQSFLSKSLPHIIPYNPSPAPTIDHQCPHSIATSHASTS
mgnify:CR=1 FL=1